eukprot:SAG11_NODE_7182_length_1182_cov_1.222530_3_plen_97_part_00
MEATGAPCGIRARQQAASARRVLPSLLHGMESHGSRIGGAPFNRHPVAPQVALKVPMAQQTLVYKLRELLDTQTLAAASVEDRSILHLRCPVRHPT